MNLDLNRTALADAEAKISGLFAATGRSGAARAQGRLI